MSVGSQFATARHEQHRTIAEVAAATKMRPWIVEALEQDRLWDVMSPAYVKQFITLYARYLRIDPEPFLMSFDPQLSEAAPDPLPTRPSHAPLSVTWSWASHLPARQFVIAGSVACLLMVAATASAHHWLSLSWHLPMHRPSLASLTPLNELPNAPTLPKLTLLATEPLELSVNAHRTTWIRVRADGKLVTQQRLQRGATEQWSAKQRFELVIAQPSSVDLLLNGHPISPFAMVHHGKLLITHAGVTALPETSSAH